MRTNLRLSVDKVKILLLTKIKTFLQISIVSLLILTSLTILIMLYALLRTIQTINTKKEELYVFISN